MRVTYLHQYFKTLRDSGGTRSYEMASRLVRGGHEVNMITSDSKGRHGGRLQTTIEDGIVVHWLPIRYANQMSYPRRMEAFARFAAMAALTAARLPADLVFASSTPLTVCLPGVAAARARRVPFVFEVRDLWPSVPVALGALRSPATIAAAEALERFAYDNSARVVALTEDMKEGVARAGYPRERITVIPNGCDLALFSLDDEEARRARGALDWLGGRKLFLYAGALGKLNGVSFMVDLAAECARRGANEVCFATIGEGAEEEIVRERARRAGVLGRSFFMFPPAEKARMPGWLAAADMVSSFVLDVPELDANCANKLFDGLAAGRPVMINHRGWQDTMLSEAGAGFSVPRDIVRAADVLLERLGDDGWLASAGAAARRLAETRFARDELARRLEAVLMEAASE